LNIDILTDVSGMLEVEYLPAHDTWPDSFQQFDSMHMWVLDDFNAFAQSPSISA